MHQFKKWPLAIAVSSSLALAGCLGGSGGSSSSSGSGGTTDPAPGETFSYSVAVELPTVIADARAPQSLAEKLVSTALNSLISQALAQDAGFGLDVQPADISLRRFVADGDDETLEDTEVNEEENGTFTVQSPQGPANDIYVQVNTGSFVLSVPASQASLVANPITTLITQQIANRLGQLDQLTLEEINALVESIERLAEDEDVRNAIDMAVFNSNSTEQLLSALNIQLSAIVNQALDDFTTPAAEASVASNANGDFYNRAISIGVFADDVYGNAGGVLTGQRVSFFNATFGADSVQVDFKANEELNIEFVHNFVSDAGFINVLADVPDEADSETLPLDARGILIPEQESFGDYDVENSTDGSQFYCLAELNAQCTDREYAGSSRVSAAGPATNPFSTLVTSDFTTREVRDLASNNQLVVRVLSGGLEAVIKKPTSPVTLSGDYGMVEFANVSRSGAFSEMELESYLLEGSFDGSGTLTFCEPLSRFVYANLNMLNPEFMEERTDCSNPANQETVGYDLASDGQLELAPGEEFPSGGWLSADGLTFLTGYEDPNLQDVVEEGGTLETGSGETQMIIGVKRAGNIDLSGRNYRLMAVGTNVETDAIGMHLISAGSLRFDGQGEPGISASLVLQNIDSTGLAAAFNNFPLDLPTLDSNLSEGRISFSGEYSVNSTAIDFSAEGYVQEGGRLIILNHLLENDGGTLNGIMLAVCTNCND